MLFNKYLTFTQIFCTLFVLLICLRNKYIFSEREHGIQKLNVTLKLFFFYFEKKIYFSYLMTDEDYTYNKAEFSQIHIVNQVRKTAKNIIILKML